MRLTTHTDYGLRVLLYLAAAPDALATVGEIAKAYRISRNHLVKVAGELARLGYVDAVRGRAGGIRLGRKPAQIGIGKVVRDLEPDFALVECFHPPTNACVISQGCSLKGPLYAAQRAFLSALDQFTLADIMKSRSLGAQLTQLRS